MTGLRQTCFVADNKEKGGLKLELGGWKECFNLSTSVFLDVINVSGGFVDCMTQSVTFDSHRLAEVADKPT